MKHPGKYLTVICGPTASGKTHVAIQLAKHYQTEIISTDSRQLYKELNIGTAKPTKDELSAVPHHFIDHVSITDEYNAGKFETESIELLDTLFSKKNIVIAAGGTGLYINALLEGLDDIPNAGKEIRDEVIREYNNRGLDYLRQLAKEADPVAYEQTDNSNHQRLMRIVEVFRATGKPISAYRTKSRKDRSFQVIKIGLEIDRAVLYDRINNRVDAMMDAGLLEEVRSLQPFSEYNGLQTVGYTELFDHLNGKMSLERAIELIKRNSRRYAKRQMTWFRKDEDIHWFTATDVDSMINLIDFRTK